MRFYRTDYDTCYKISIQISTFSDRATIGRTKLEYASAIWSPNTVKHCSLIKNIRWRATKCILNNPKEMSYTERLGTTDLFSLQGVSKKSLQLVKVW